VSQSLESVLALQGEARLEALVRLADDLTQAADAGEIPEVSAVVEALLEVIESGEGASKLRMAAGEALGRLGDPRVVGPEHPDYWVKLELDLGAVEVGRFPVTIHEWQGFVGAGGYERDDHWTEEALAWRDSAKRLWPELAARDSVRHLVIPNQPVVGVSWHEARAYAKRHEARLLSFGERMQVARGDEKRPYPWGAPFGSGNANTREEVLGKPCAVGLFRRDCTPDGVYDLAGNVAEWTADRVDDACVVHPGSWEQPSMASWAKARELEPARTRGADLGFRIARDVED
jgi:formylglycine-generating enzyme required for sulfatase activity